ncbi:MAG: DNA polymerase III subunit alpha [Bacteroidales bacterium]|nr:DNA polymerase III subunit alpha [Bacteroidales bacterium]
MYLNCHTYYSLRYGTISVADLVEEGVRNHASALCLTDINNSTGIVDFVAACKERGIKPIAGIEFRRDNRLLYIGLAKNNEGFRELNEFLSHYNLNNLPLPDQTPEFNNVYTIYPFQNSEIAKWRNGEILSPETFVGIRPSELNAFFLSRHRDLISRMVLMAPVTFRNEKEYELHRNFRAVDNNVLLSRLESDQLAAADEFMRPIDKLIEICAAFPAIIQNTEKLIDSCSIDFDYKSCKNKRTFTGTLYDDRILLEKLAMDGLEYRYGKYHTEAIDRIRHELEVICNMKFAAYFLIAWDIIRYSMSRGFYHVGRGSGANSIVAYCLKITDVDPIDLDLYFERFINSKRTFPPDFDIDYSWKERDAVLDYIFKRYGRGSTALLGAMSTFKDKSIYRELGKVHGLPMQEMDAFLKHPEEAINQNDIVRKIHDLGEMMADFPNLRSIHAGGVLISEEPITCYTALDLPSKGFPATQWDMYVAEDIGFEKLDILSQRGIGHIYETAEIVKKNRRYNVDVHRIGEFKKDEKVRELLRKGKTIGCFYVESPAMRGLLKKLQCDNYRSLVAASSIIRPGVARSGMMKEYIYRFHHPDKIRYLHPVMEEQLKETYGVMVYQEDVLKICHHFAGLDLADSDVLRRAMSGKYRSKKELQRIIDKFFDNCRKSGYPEIVIKEVWRQIESFAGYSFSKAHSASYAVESYQSLFLKAHFPLEFMVGVINNFGGFYPGWVYFNEAHILGGKIHLPCVNQSEYKTSICENNIYIGFIHISDLENQVGKSIYDLRFTTRDLQKTEEPYKDLEDFVERVPITLDQLIILIRVGAFRFTGKPKATLLWEAHMLLGKIKSSPIRHQSFDAQNPDSSIDNYQLPIINAVTSKNYELPVLWQSHLEEVYDEIELLGWPVTHSWFDLLETSFRGEIMALDMIHHVKKRVRMLGLLVTIKYARTVKKEWMHFGTFIDVNGQFFDTVHFPQVVNKFPFRGEGIYLILGKIVEEFGFPSLEVEKMAKMPFKKDPRG